MKTSLQTRTLSLGALSPAHGSVDAATPSLPQPASRWKTRIALPLLVVACAGGLLAYAARQALLPATAVRVVSVVTRQGTIGGASAAPTLIVQAPGWIEPDPFAVNVPALADGVIRELLVLEGQRVEADEVVARMIDAEALVAVHGAEAMVAVRAAELEAAGAQAQQAEAEVVVEERLADEIRDEVERKRPLADGQLVAAGEFRRLELRLQTQQGRIRAAQAALAEAKARVDQAAAEHAVAGAQLASARLTRDRMEIRSPCSGIVLARLAEPGTRMMASSQDPAGSVVLRLYDPSRLQVRVDIPLADAAKVGVDQEAEITTEALSDRVFRGRVSRLIHEANIQKNTVQVKVSIVDPAPELKPEMLTRVRFFSGGTQGGERGQANAGAPGVAAGSSALRVFAPEAALQQASGDRAEAWVFDEARSAASLRELTLGRAALSGWREVLAGLTAGDRVVIDPPPNLTPSTRLRIVSEARDATAGVDSP